MSKLTDLRTKAESALVTASNDVKGYVAGLEARVATHRNISIGVAAAVALIAIVWIAYKL